MLYAVYQSVKPVDENELELITDMMFSKIALNDGNFYSNTFITDHGEMYVSFKDLGTGLTFMGLLDEVLRYVFVLPNGDEVTPDYILKKEKVLRQRADECLLSEEQKALLVIHFYRIAIKLLDDNQIIF